MKHAKLASLGLLQAAGVFGYVALVAFFMTRVERTFSQVEDRTLMPIAFLLLFTLSAAIVGSLVFGRAAFLFLTGLRREAVVLAGWTVTWLFVITVLVFATLLATR